MSKELTPLEAWEKIKDIIREDAEDIDNLTLLVNELSIIETALKTLEIIKKYTYSGGWSGDYTTRYWDMKINEIKVIDGFFKSVPINALSGRK